MQEEPLGEDDLRVFTKDRVKKDNHNQSELECVGLAFGLTSCYCS